MNRMTTAKITPDPFLEDHPEEPTKMMWSLKVDTASEVYDILGAAEELGVSLHLVKQAQKAGAQRRYEVTLYVTLPGMESS